MSPTTEKTASFFSRAITNDSFKKGVVGALVAVVGELVFPSNA